MSVTLHDVVLWPHDAMLARNMLSSSVRLSVCLSARPSVTSRYYIETTGRIELVLAWTLPSMSAIRKFGHLQKLGYFPLELCIKLRTFRNIAMESRSRCQQNSSTIELVDDTHLCDSRRVVAVYYKSVDCNRLTPLWICCTTGFYSLQYFDWQRGSRASCFNHFKKNMSVIETLY